jgi:hypothetical protein
MAKAMARSFSVLCQQTKDVKIKLYNFACVASWIVLINGVIELELMRVAREEEVML